jgi:hypothetical protein
MYYFRQVFATYLRSEGVESVLIDMLQTRTSSSVFVRQYYRPDLSKLNEMREKLLKLQTKIT